MFKISFAYTDPRNTAGFGLASSSHNGPKEERIGTQKNVMSRVPRVAGGVWSEREARAETQTTVGHGDQGSQCPETGVQRLGKVRPVLTEN